MNRWAPPTRPSEQWLSDVDARCLTKQDVTTREVSAQQVAAVRRHTSMQTIGDDISAGFNQVSEAMETVGVRMVGRPFIVFHGRIDV